MGQADTQETTAMVFGMLLSYSFWFVSVHNMHEELHGVMVSLIQRYNATWRCLLTFLCWISAALL